MSSPTELIERLPLAAVEAKLLEQRRVERERAWHPRYPHQEPPAGDWHTWLLLGGRGTGKTEGGARYVLEHLRSVGSSARVGIGAPTIADARDVCAEGETGLITVAPYEFPVYNRSLLEARHITGGYVKFLGSEEPGRWNGPQWTLLWADELGLWNIESWHQAQFGLRLGERPHAIATTTAKRHLARNLKVIKELKRQASEPSSGIVMTQATSYEATGLSKKVLERLEQRYGGTVLGRQELMGEIIEEVEGAMWQQGWIEAARVRTAPELSRVVVAIDPAVTHGEDADETGIVAAGRGDLPCESCTAAGFPSDFYILDARGYRLSPEGWARRAVDLFDERSADRLIAERNNGGEMVEATIKHVRPGAHVDTIVASRGKTVRAEPVAALYEQGRVHHVGIFPGLEEQLTSFPVAQEQDDVLDAMVYAVTELDSGGVNFRWLSTV